MDGGLITDLCFYQIVDPGILNNNETFVYMEGNIALITGYNIYAGTVEDCASLFTSEFVPPKIFSTSQAIFSHEFHFKFQNITFSSLYQLSSQPDTICYCYQESGLLCDENAVPIISIYPGQTFGILAVGMGVGISLAVIRSQINSKYDISPKLKHLERACEPLNHTILAPENTSGILVQQ